MTKKEFRIITGRRITEVRLQKHMTQQQVADLAGISTPYYSQIENGNKTVSSYVLTQIVTALQTSSDYILFGWSSAADDTINRYLGRLTNKEFAAIRGFLDLCNQQFQLVEAGSSEDNDELAASAPIR